jgi:hypothetical protein
MNGLAAAAVASRHGLERDNAVFAHRDSLFGRLAQGPASPK